MSSAAIRSAICSYISAMFSNASRSSGYLLAPMRGLIAFLSQWAAVRAPRSCSSVGCAAAVSRSLTTSALRQTAAQDLPKRFHFGSKQFDRHLGKLIGRIGNQTTLGLDQIGPRLLNREIKSVYFHL
jgi:hypothetical protein